jgi:hypothetical protein
LSRSCSNVMGSGSSFTASQLGTSTVRPPLKTKVTISARPESGAPAAR